METRAPDPPAPVLFLVDGHSQIYRAYHAIRGLSGPDGQATNAVFGFVAMLRKLLADQKPDFIACVFDLAGPTFRSALAADYKANRPAMPDDLVEQIPWIHRSCEALGVRLLSHEGFEADDVIGTMAERAAAAGYRVVVVTGDKDLFQLVRGDILVFNPRDDGTWFDSAAVVEKFGVPPDRVVDVLALMGDPVDNIKGVPGIGEKGARELITTYGSLDTLLARVAEIPQRRYREALLAHRDLAHQSRELARLRLDVPIAVDLAELRYRGADRDACYALFGELGFRSLMTEYAPAPASVTKDYTVIESLDAVRRLADELRRAGRFGLRLLTTAAAAVDAEIVGLVVSTAPGQAAYIPLAHHALDTCPQADRRTALAVLQPVLEDPRIEKVGHDVKTDVVVLARYGIGLRGIAFDTMIASYLIDASRSSHPLEGIALEHLGHKADSEETLRGRGSRALGFEDLPPHAVVDFAGERADLALRLASRLGPRLEADGLAPVFHDLELPLIPVLAEIEQTGVALDCDVLRRLSERLDNDLTQLGARVFDLAGETFNINSPKQLGEILFDKLKMPAGKRTGKTRAASTAVDVLEELALSHELPRLILEWRSLQKLKGTYVDALPQLVNRGTGRVHTRFNQAVAATGRLSSSDPNLQNIPVRTELGREIRAAFVTERGWRLISADYSQIELRVLAHLSGDATLVEAFQRGEDIHDQTAARVFGTTSGLDPHELRRRAKIINYALLYGKTAFTLARDIGVTPQAAQAFIDAYFDGYPDVRRYIDRLLDRARASGVVATMFGRRRPVPELTSQNAQVRAAAERAAVNMPIQGTAADILKRAMIDVHLMLEEHRAHGGRTRMILTVHDELLFEAPADEADEMAALVRSRMERAVPMVVPLTVDVGIGANWREAKA